MKITEIKKMVAEKDNLSNQQKMQLVEGILTNKQARETAIVGALSENNFQLALHIIFKQ